MLTATLSVSRTGLKCEDVVRTLQRLSVVADVTQNTTLVSVGKHLRKENGCRVVMGQISSKGDVRRVWEALKSDHGLRCAHARIQGDASGCVYDLFDESSCPG